MEKDIDIIVNDIVGTIVLIVEDEGEFSHDINDFIDKNYDIFVKSNKLSISMKEIFTYDIESKVSKKLIEEGYIVETIEDGIYVKSKN